MYYLGIDIGGTNLVAGIVDEDYQIIEKCQAKTEVPCEESVFIEALYTLIGKLLKKTGLTLNDVPWVGIGSPGAVNRNTGILQFTNNLYFRNFQLRGMMQERLGGKKVIVENDANAAAYGEHIAGALQGVDNGIAITLGTGVGGGLIIDRKVYSGSNCAGGELGHTVIVVDGKPCTCGRNGCWESYSSATGLIRITKEHMADAKADAPIKKLAAGGHVTGRTAFDAMRLGDPVGTAIVDEYIKYLGVGITNMVNIFQPAILCIGGGISNEGETLLKPLREFVSREQYAIHASQQTVIVKALLGNDAGVIGAAVLGLQDQSQRID